MTLPNGSNNPPISLGDINTEFGLGANLGAYYGQRWFKDDNSRGYFQNSGVVSISDFYSKRKNSPVTSGSATYNYNASNNPRTIPFPMFNNLTVTVVSGQGGTAGNGGNCYGGTGGGTGGATNFGSYVATGTGSPAGYGSSGSTSSNTFSWAISDANQASIIALYNVGVSSTIGNPGSAGASGKNNSVTCATSGGVTICVNNCDQQTGGGSQGASGYVTLSWT